MGACRSGPAVSDVARCSLRLRERGNTDLSPNLLPVCSRGASGKGVCRSDAFGVKSSFVDQWRLGNAAALLMYNRRFGGLHRERRAPVVSSSLLCIAQ